MYARLHVRAPRGPPQHHLNDLLRARLPFRVAQHARTAEVTPVAKRVRQPLRQRHVPQPTALRHRHVTLPLGTSHAQLPLVEIDVRPLQRHDLAASQPSLPAKEHGQVRLRFRSRRFDEPFVLVEIVEGGRTLRRAEQPNRARHPLDHAPLHRGLQDDAQPGQHVCSPSSAIAPSVPPSTAAPLRC